MFVIELITIDSIFGVCFYIASFDVRNLVTADAYIAATNSGRTVRTKSNLSPCGLIASSGLVADRSDVRQVLSQLDFQFSTHVVHADVVGGQLRTICTADDIDSVVQLLGDSFSCIFLAIVAGKLQAIFHGSYLVVSSRIFIYNAGNAILAINTVSAFDTFRCIRCIVSALLDGNINFCILAICTGGSYEANGPRSAVLTIFSRCANNNLGHSSIEGLIHRTAGNELLAAVRFFIRGVRISNLARTNGFAPIIQICLLCCCISDMGTDIVSSHICLQRQLVIRIASFFFNHAVDVTNVGGIVLICICIGSVSCSKAALNISNLTAIDTDTAIVLQVNLCTSSSLGITFASCCLVGNGCNACKVLGQLDFQLAIHVVHADVVGGQLPTICTADDIDSVIQLLGDSFSCIFLAIVAGKFQAVFHGSHLIFPVLVFIDNPVDAIFAIHTVGTFSTIFAIFARLDGDIHNPILAVRAGRAYEADGTRRTIFTIFARRTNDNLCHTTIKGFIDCIAGDQVAIIFSDGSIITDFNLTICIDAQMFAGIDGQLMVLGEFQSITFVDGNGLLRLIHEDAVALGISVIGNILSVLLYLIIQCNQVCAGGLGNLHIFPIFGRPYFVVHRAAGDQLLGAIVILGHGTGTQSLAPGVFVGGHISVFEVLADIGGIDAGQFLDLGHVDGIGVVCTGGYAVDLASYCAICFTDGYSRLGSLPSSSTICRILTGSRIISFYRITFHSCNRTTADSYTISNKCIGHLSKGNGISNFVSINLSRSTDGNIASGNCMGFRADGNTVISCRGIHTNCYGIAASCRSSTTNSNRIVSTSIAGCIGIVANDDRVISFSLSIFSITRTNDYRVLLSSQCMIIADDNIRLVGSFDWQDLVIIIAVAGKFIVGPDDIIMLAVNDLIVEAIDVVVL